MTPFLSNIAQNLFFTYKEKLQDSCVVFPNRRAGLFFTAYLSEVIDKPIWNPTTITIKDLVQQLSDLVIADPLKLIFELYEVYRIEKKTNESFDEFYFWGEMLLNDFDDIDKYLINTSDLFSNLSSLKSLSDQFNYLSDNQLEAIQTFWKSFNPGKFSNNQKDFIHIWSVLDNIYNKYNQKLRSEKLAYEGMVYRDISDKIDSGKIPDLAYKKIFFIGFNALNNCEEKLFNHLKNNNLAHFFWDYDDYYINNKIHTIRL